MMLSDQALLIAGFAFIALTLAFIGYRLTLVQPLPRPTLGSRGERRTQALQAEGLFSSLEPAVRKVGAWLAPLPISGLRASLDRSLREAGNYLGLCADELLALGILSSVGFGVVCLGLGFYFNVPLLGLMVGSFAGLMLLHNQVSETRDSRFKAVNRGLPTEIDLASMCLGAGMDLPGALRLIVQQRNDPGDVLCYELAHVLRELDLGHTRAAALRGLEARVPTEAVRELVGAIIQAEEKGTPLAEVLRIQAGMLRMRRTILAEESAARAGVLMMIPLIMLLGSILIILMGSMVITTAESGMFK
jgi:tight adherence protein C